ncbi:hypothetical protein HMN09_01381800 [Mycena chlorophos]|uniref:Glycosyltransferase 61 catalytic domain-containing protein n=1 Tax=Mycena chlorophos TaxID=658473 RepID=A0A8H6VSL1_MYCCL|nr:hypothetical protein HMN09_01381800 [Mycena chlorophos]
MPIRHSFTRRDVLLLLLGAVATHFFHLLFPADSPQPEILIEQPIRDTFPPDPPPPEQVIYRTTTTTRVQATTTTVATTVVVQPSVGPSSETSLEFVQDFPPTTLVSHAPGWTMFRDLYMSNDTFYVVTDHPAAFPEIRLMTSTPLKAEAEAENIRLREPSEWSMVFITPAQAAQKWGEDVRHGRRNRVSSVAGNTVFVNEPTQFLRHYYHFTAELIMGVQAMWSGSFTEPSTDPDREYSLGPFPPLPLINRFIFARANADGIRDNPGFNRYIMRAAFPSASVEEQEDWEDRVSITQTGERAWHFPLLLLTDRSASFRGEVCGSQTQRTAAEAFEEMKRQGRLAGIRVGGWWEPVRAAVLRFAGAEVRVPDISEQMPFNGDTSEGDPRLPMPSKVLITYISRQSAGQRKLTREAHQDLVNSMEELVRRKGPSWEFLVVEAEHLTRDEQLQIAARTTILLGVHGNGLTHLIMMQPTRISTVIEIFYPEGFAHDYQWTTRALGMKHFAVWNDTYRTEGVGEGKPSVNYPEGFQRDYIPVHGPTIAKLVEDRVELRV